MTALPGALTRLHPASAPDVAAQARQPGLPAPGRRLIRSSGHLVRCKQSGARFAAALRDI